MTSEEFDALSVMMGNHTNSPSLKALRLVLVDGLTQMDAAKQFGVTHQTVGQKMARARQLHAAAQILAGAEMPEKRTYPAAS